MLLISWGETKIGKQTKAPHTDDGNPLENACVCAQIQVAAAFSWSEEFKKDTIINVFLYMCVVL